MGSRYVQQTLSAGESILYETKLHWIKLAVPTMWVFLMALSIIGISFAVGYEYVKIYVLLALLAVPSIVTYYTSEFTLTNKRLVVKVGWLRRRTIEINIEKLESASVDQGILGRMLDFGTIVFTGIGGTREPFKRVARPFQFREALMNIHTKG